MSGEVIKRCAPDVLARLEEFYRASGCTMQVIARKCGYSESVVSRYLSGSPTGDVAAFESAVVEMMDKAARRRRWDDVFFQTEAVSKCFQMFAIIDASNEVGLIYGPAGIGKSTACGRYAAENSTVLHLCAREGSGSWYSMVRALWAQIDTRGWNAKARSEIGKTDYIAARLRGSDRLLIVDNAQRLSVSGIKWLLDMQDDAGFGLAFVGNAEILDKVAANDQLASRIRIRRNVLLDGEDKQQIGWLDDAADKMVAAMWPDAAKEIRRLARESVRQQGYLRRLNSQLKVAIRLHETPAFTGRAAAAFVEARHLIATPAVRE